MQRLPTISRCAGHKKPENEWMSRVMAAPPPANDMDHEVSGTPTTARPRPGCWFIGGCPVADKDVCLLSTGPGCLVLTDDEAFTFRSCTAGCFAANSGNGGCACPMVCLCSQRYARNEKTGWAPVVGAGLGVCRRIIAETNWWGGHSDTAQMACCHLQGSRCGKTFVPLVCSCRLIPC